jgi:ferredoxin
MPFKITFSTNKLTIRANGTSTVLSSIIKAGIPWKSQCATRGTCAKCKFKVIEGHENINPLTETEERLRFQKFLGDDERLACKVIVKGNIKIEASTTFLENIDNQS